jgi:peroxiredoxin
MSLTSSPRVMVDVGEIAPDFILKAHDKSEVSLSSFLGSRVILSFYPAAFTGVCKNQACSINNQFNELSSNNVNVLGISVDSPFSNNAFREQNNIDYPLLSDVHREVISAYGITFENFAIDGYTVAQRSVFLVEEDGTIGYAWYAENPGIEPDYDELFSYIRGEN